MMNRKTIFLTIAILLIGIVYRLSLTANGNFLFNMDNARDMVDVREMVVLGKLRLTGPTSAIEGLFNGPAWYYLLAIPFILSGGDPYAEILMEIVLWAVGGFFLLKLTSRFGMLAMLVSGSLWIASNYIVLTNLYAFNPNAVTLLTPLLIFLIEKYLATGKLIFALLMWFLGGLFFNFEMNFGIFVPPIIFFSLLFSKKTRFLKDQSFWLGFLFFIATLLPQVLFDLRHQFIMSSSIVRFLSERSTGSDLNLLSKSLEIYGSFFDTSSATLMNQKKLTQAALIIVFIYLVGFLKKKEYLADRLILVCLLFIFIPFLGYVLLPVKVNSWHLGGPMVALIIILSIILSRLFKLGLISRAVSLLISGLIIFYAVFNLVQYFTQDRFQVSLDPSLFRNEIQVIDYVYKKAEGKNFKVYTYLPSVYDYPYQYLFWWYGAKIYGYIPGEYVYSPNKPPYIPSQDKFQGLKENFSGLVFLIKEPDRIGFRGAWEDEFKYLQFISKEIVGPIEVEVRAEVSQS